MHRFTKRSNAISGRLAGALLMGAVALGCAAGSAKAGNDCNGKEFFFSEYGDNTQAYDATTGSVDRFDSYTSPACFMTWLLSYNRPLENTDDATSNANAFYPFVLDGYPSFDPDNVSYAVLRIDVFYEHRDTYFNDAFAAFNDTTCATSGGYGFAQDLRARLIQVDQDRSQWVAINVDITSGRVFAAGIDNFGVPIPGLDYGQIGTLASGVGAQMLVSASDGDLYGAVQDDLRIGYVALIGLAGCPSTDLVRCPTSVSLVRGQYDSGGVGNLCADDGNYLIYRSAGSSGMGVPLAKIVEFEVTFTGVDPGRAYCDFCVTIMGNTGLRPDTVEVWLRDFTQSGNVFEMVDSAYFPKAPESDGFRKTCIANPSPKFISATGEVTVKLKMARWRWPGIYHVATDLVTLTTRTVP